MGAVGKKAKKSGNMRLREGSTLYEFCESFRYIGAFLPPKFHIGHLV